MADERPPDWITSELRQAAQRERAPAHLRARIEDLAREPTRRPARSAPARRLRVAIPAVAAIAAVVLALILVLPGGSPGAPSLAQAAALGARPATTRAPAGDPTDPGEYLAVGVGGLRFPDWGRVEGWHASGERTDRLGNRAVITVYYRRGAETVAYSIVSVPALAGQKRGYASFQERGRTVVSWEEQGHSCLLSGSGVSAAQLTRLAIDAATSAD